MTVSTVRKLVALWAAPYLAFVGYFIFADENRLKEMPGWFYWLPLIYFAGGIVVLSAMVSRAQFSDEEKRRALNLLQRNARLWHVLITGQLVALCLGMIVLVWARIPLIYGAIVMAVSAGLSLLSWRLARFSNMPDSNQK